MQGHRRRRIAIVTTHPVQYHGPWFRKLAADERVDLKVLFACDHGQKPSFDAGFNATFEWDRPLTDGYAHEFLPNIHPKPGPQSFFSRTNPILWRRLRPEFYDAAIVFGWGYLSTLIALAAAEAHGVATVMHSESNLGPRGRPPWKARARKAVLTALFRRVDAFLAVGTLGREMYAAYGAPPERVFVAPYAADNEFFEAERERLEPHRDALRAELGVTDDRPIVVSSGKLLEDKAPLDLVRAFAKVRRERAAKLVFLGDGPLRGEVLEVARHEGVVDDVAITGFRNQRELGRVYVASDLLAFPSRRETWGIVINEAMLFGLPVICSDQVTAHHDLVTPGVTGDVYPVGDVEALASLMAKRLAAVQCSRALGREGQRRIAAFSYDQCVEGTVAAVDAAIAAKGLKQRTL